MVLQVVGLDMVDDESRPERRPAKHMQTPAEWNLKHNPAYSYYAYYVYANLFTLNKLREARGLNTIAFRPHAGRQPLQVLVVPPLPVLVVPPLPTVLAGMHTATSSASLHAVLVFAVMQFQPKIV